MKILKNIILLSSVIMLFNSCKNDLKLNAPYKEMPSIYGVLNPDDAVHTIRINKVFLGEANASTMAQVPDSINYPPGELSVTLTRFVNGNQVAASGSLTTITFSESIVETDPGAFNPNQRVYVANAPLYGSGDYVLTVYNNHTKNTFKAKATVLNNINPYIYAPFIGLPYPVPAGSPYDALNFIDYSGVTQSYKVRYKANAGKIFQLVMRVHYYDSLLNGNPPSYKNYTYADYPFSNQYTSDITTTNDLVNTFKGQDVFDAVGKVLASRPNNPDVIGRKLYKIEYLVYTSTKEYSDYLQFSAPSLSINQEKHLYSNFENSDALGLFTFRTSCSVSKDVDNTFISAFATNKATCSYKFFNSSLNRPGCQ